MEELEQQELPNEEELQEAQAQDASAPNKPAFSRFKGLLAWVETFVLTFAVLLFLITFVGRYAPVDGTSMTPTLQNGDMVLLTNLGAEAQQGDIVVVQSNRYGYEQPLVKRVIATGGQTVTIDPEAWTVTVDGVTLDEPYILKSAIFQMAAGNSGKTTWTVPVGKLFVMGDNRNDSLDSRFYQIGYIDARMVVGKVFFRLFPFSSFGSVT